MKKLISLLAIGLTGCGDVEPIYLGGEQSRYIGTWFHEDIRSSSNNIAIKRVYLDIRLDSSADYSSCFVSKTWKNGSSSTSSSSNSVQLPNALITQLIEDTITLTMDVAIFSFDYDIDVTAPPYQVDDQWYIDIDKTTLKKLTRSEANALNEVTCPDSEQLQQNG